MRNNLIAVVAMSFVFVTAAHAQHVTVTIKCAKPDQEHAIPADDTAGHAYSVAHMTCTYTKPGELAGVQNKDASGTFIGEAHGDRMNWRGTYVAN